MLDEHTSCVTVPTTDINGPTRPSWTITYLKNVLSASVSHKDTSTHAEAKAINNVVKYNGLKRIAMASFQPSTTSTPYIQYGIWLTLKTVLLFAST